MLDGTAHTFVFRVGMDSDQVVYGGNTTMLVAVVGVPVDSKFVTGKQNFLKGVDF